MKKKEINVKIAGREKEKKNIEGETLHPQTFLCKNKKKVNEKKKRHFKSFSLKWKRQRMV